MITSGQRLSKRAADRRRLGHQGGFPELVGITERAFEIRVAQENAVGSNPAAPAVIYAPMNALTNASSVAEKLAKLENVPLGK